MYLLHHCQGTVKDAIELGVLFSEGEYYTKAINILRKQFGRSRDIVEAFLMEFLGGPSLHQDDVSGLQRLIRS